MGTVLSAALFRGSERRVFFLLDARVFRFLSVRWFALRDRLPGMLYISTVTSFLSYDTSLFGLQSVFFVVPRKVLIAILVALVTFEIVAFKDSHYFHAAH